MTPVICVVGKSNTGKTTLLEKLIPELTARGYRVGTVKHDVHGFDMDKPGKDSWRHTQAGAYATVVSSPQKVAVIKKVDQEKEIDEITAMIIDDVDIVLTEGYKRSNKLKIEISRSAVSTELLCSEDELIAIVSDVSHPMRVPQFGLDDMKGLVDLLEEAYLRHPKRQSASLFIDGKEVPMKDFVQDIFDGAIRGMVSSLHGSAGARDIVVKLEAGEVPILPAESRE